MTARQLITIVHSDVRRGRSGHDAAVYRLVCALAAQSNVAVRLVTGSRPGPLPHAVEVVRLPCLPVWHLSLRFLSFLMAWSIYRRLRRRLPGEVVYLGSPLLGGGDLAAVHFVSLDWRDAMRVQPPPCNWRLRLRVWHDHLRHGLAAPLENWAYRKVARGQGPRLLPVSQGLARSLEARFGPLPGMVRVPNIVDTAAFRPVPEPHLEASVRAAAGWPPNWPIVLFVGGAWQRKGLNVALRAIAALSRPAGLLVVGPGPQAALQNEARRLGVAAQVHAVGAQADTAPFYRIA
ncbi:MAG: glycosyltransferase, partial [Rhodospirillaceae bacterium]